MLRLICLTLLVTLTCATPLLKSTRMIEGIVSCGSAGTLLDLTLKEVNGTHECLKVPCDIHVGHTYDLDVDFIPSQSHKAINVYASVTFTDGVSHDLVNTTLSVEVIGGEGYTFNYPWKVTGSLGTGAVTLHIEVGNDDVIELCGEASGLISED